MTEVKHITMVATLPPVKGVSDYCMNQVPELQKKIGVDFYNFSDIYPEAFYPGKSTKDPQLVPLLKPMPNAKVHTTLTWYNPITWIMAGLNAKGEILHIHWWTFYLFHVFFTIAFLAKLRGKKVVCTVHNVKGNPWGLREKIIGLGEGLFTKLVFSQVDHFIVHTDKNKRQLQSTFAIPESKISIIPHGTYDFYRDEKVTKALARKKLSILPDAKVLLSYGNIREYKGIFDAIAAFKLARVKVPKLFLLIAGPTWGNTMEKTIRDELAGIEDVKLDFHYINAMETKYYFEASDLVLLPYLEFAGQSGPGNIALAFEKPMIVSRVGGLPDLVPTEKCVVPPNKPTILAERIEEILGSPTVYRKLIKDSIPLRKKFGWEKISQQTIDLYQSLLG